MVLVLVLYLQGSANVFTEGRTRGCDPSQAASPVSFLHPMPCSGCQGGCRAESWHGAASQASRTSAPLLTAATLSAGHLHHNQQRSDGAMSSSSCLHPGCAALLFPSLYGWACAWGTCGCCGGRWVPCFERVPGCPAQTIPILGRWTVLAVIQTSQRSPSIFKVLGILWLNIGAPGLGCCREGQYGDLSVSLVTCVTVVFKAEGSLWGAAGQPNMVRSDSHESCTCREMGVKISKKIPSLKHSGGRPSRLAGCKPTARGGVSSCLRFKKKCAVYEGHAFQLWWQRRSLCGLKMMNMDCANSERKKKISTCQSELFFLKITNHKPLCCCFYLILDVIRFSCEVFSCSECF